MSKCVCDCVIVCVCVRERRSKCVYVYICESACDRNSTRAEAAKEGLIINTPSHSQHIKKRRREGKATPMWYECVRCRVIQ